MKKGFTLAEVLITLMILGIIAALVVPARIERANERATVVKVKKFYSNLQQAYNRAVIENGTPDVWSNSSEEIYATLIKPYFNIRKVCATETNGCVGSTYKQLNGSGLITEINHPVFYKVSLQDGSSLGVKSDLNNGGTVFVHYDTNGSVSPNIYGIDVFGFIVSSLDNKLYPLGVPDKLTYNNYYFDAYCSTTLTYYWQGSGCAAWVIEKGNMDYLHCSGLSWYGKQKCN